MLLKDYANNEKPRFKLLNYGTSTLSEAELIAIILNNGTKSVSVMDLSQMIIKKIEDEGGINNITLQELMTIKGVGEVTAIKILAVIELSKRLNNQDKRALMMSGSSEVYSYLINNHSFEMEELVILYFNQGGKFLAEKVYTISSDSSIEFDDNEILRWAFKFGAKNIILAHNHPSGNPFPSGADISKTKKVIKLCRSFNINLVDHIVFTSSDYISMKKMYADIF